MGNCVPVQRGSQQSMQLQLSINTKAESDGNLGPKQLYKSHLSSNVVSFQGSNGAEEIYFDSVPWIESDTEDFYSVNGDFTPSRGNSPIHQSNFVDSPQLRTTTEDVAANMVSKSSPNNKKKLLIELFRESFNDDSRESDYSLQVKGEVKSSPIPFSHISLDKNPYELSDDCSESSRATLHTGSSYVIVKSRSKPCCIPNIVRSLSFSETKKKLCFYDTSGG